MNNLVEIDGIKNNAISDVSAVREVAPKRWVHHDIADCSLFENVIVHKEPLFDINNDKMLNGFALFYSDGSRASETAVTDSYALTNHAELYSQHADLIKNKSTLPWRNVEVTDEIADGGLRAKRTIKYLDWEMNLSNNSDVNDPVFCRSDIYNSTNMSWAFQMFAGAYRDLCQNSMVFGGYKSGYAKKKHTKNFAEMRASLLSTANKTLATFKEETARFMAWSTTKITNEQAMNFIRTMCDTRTDNQKRYDKISSRVSSGNIIEEPNKFNEKKFYALCALWEEYSLGYKQGGGLDKTVWALYNVFTHWATHTHDAVEYTNAKNENKVHNLGRVSKSVIQDSSGNVYSLPVQRDRSMEVANMLHTEEWLRMAA